MQDKIWDPFSYFGHVINIYFMYNNKKKTDLLFRISFFVNAHWMGLYAYSKRVRNVSVGFRERTNGCLNKSCQGIVNRQPFVCDTLDSRRSLRVPTKTRNEKIMRPAERMLQETAKGKFGKGFCHSRLRSILLCVPETDPGHTRS